MKATKAKFTVNGGIHPRYHKQLTSDKSIEVMPLPSVLRVSMAQHLGAPAKPVVKKGDTVLRGQLIGEAAGFISAAVHAPTSGTVSAIGEAATPIGSIAQYIEITPDGEDKWIEGLEGISDWEKADAKTLTTKIAECGICGMGGAGFPTNVKLSPPPDKPIDTLILNGAECEPYLTADNRVMLEKAAEIWEGCRIIQHILGAKTVRIAIEDNKPGAIAAMEKALRGVKGDVEIVALKTEYPQGAEKQQIYAITGREVPSGGLPMEVGCVVENVGTTLAVRHAVIEGKPLTERVTTVTGYPVKNPKNVLGRIGTLYSDMLEFCDGLQSDVTKIISGGPMMGLAQPTLDISTTKTTSGILLLGPQETEVFSSMPCISCGRCIEACPMYLVPAELSQLLEAEDYEEAELQNVMDCIECGSCAFSCPSHRPLVQHFKVGKSKVLLKRRAAQQKK